MALTTPMGRTTRRRSATTRTPPTPSRTATGRMGRANVAFPGLAEGTLGTAAFRSAGALVGLAYGASRTSAEVTSARLTAGATSRTTVASSPSPTGLRHTDARFAGADAVEGPPSAAVAVAYASPAFARAGTRGPACLAQVLHVGNGTAGATTTVAARLATTGDALATPA